MKAAARFWRKAQIVENRSQRAIDIDRERLDHLLANRGVQRLHK